MASMFSSCRGEPLLFSQMQDTVHDGEAYCDTSMVRFAHNCRAISLRGVVDCNVPLGPPGEVHVQQETSATKRSRPRQNTKRACPRMDDYQVQLLKEQWGDHEHAVPWAPMHIQPSGPVYPAPVRVKLEKTVPSRQAEQGMRSCARAPRATPPGAHREATLVIIEMLIFDSNENVSSGAESGPVIKAVFPCSATMLHNSIANCVHGAIGLHNLVLCDACGNHLPTHIRGDDHEYTLVFDALHHADTFASLALKASKSRAKQPDALHLLEVGALALVESSGVTHLNYELPLYLAPSDDSRVPKQWRLIVQIYYRLPNPFFNIPTASTSAECLPPAKPQQLGPSNASSSTSTLPPKRSRKPAQSTGSASNTLQDEEQSAKRSRGRNPSRSNTLTTLFDVDSIQRLRGKASSAPPAPPSARALKPIERLLVLVFYEASGTAQRMVAEVRRVKKDRHATHPFVAALPLLSLHDRATATAGPIPLYITDIGNFNGSMTLTNDAQIDWYFRHRLGGALETCTAHRLGRPEVLVLQTCFWQRIYASGPKSLTRWTRNVDWAVVRKILMPIKLPMHWALTVIRNFSFDFDPDGTMNVRGEILHFDSLRGRPDSIHAKIKEWLLHVLPLQARPQPQQPITARDKLSSRKEQPSTDPQQCDTMNCGIFTINTALAECGLLPLAHVSEEFMTHFRETLALGILRDPVCALTDKGIPRPALCMAAFQGGHVVDTCTLHSNCVPSALLAILAAHSSAHAVESLQLPPQPSNHAMDAWLRSHKSLDSRVQELLSDVVSSRTALQSARGALSKLHADPSLAANGTPVPLRALHHALASQGAKAILLVCSTGPIGFDAAYYIGDASVSDSDVTSVLLYSIVRRHVVPLLWPRPGVALEYAHLAMELFGSASFGTVQSILTCDASTTWSACGTVGQIPDWCASLSGDADSNGLAQGLLLRLLIS